VKNQNFNGNILVADHNKIALERSAGYAHFENKTPNSASTRFPIASVSKTITATAILQLAESKKLSVEDPVAKYLPGFPYPNIKIKHLLSHTSGLPPYNAYFDSLRKEDPSRVFTNKDFIPVVNNNPKPLLYQPGDSWNYDNVNYLVLALLVEKVSGTKYESYIRKNILKPAGMSNTFLYPLNEQYTERDKTNLAYPYLFPHLYYDSLVEAKTLPFVKSYWTAYSFSGFADYVTTTADLLKYATALDNGTLLGKEITETSLVQMPLSNGKINAGKYGLGWQVFDHPTGKIVFHTGNATGLSAILLRNITNNQVIIVFDNIHNNAQQVGFDLLNILNGVNVPAPRKSIAAIYARTLISKGPTAARDILMKLKSDTLNYHLSEDEMNSLGYDFLGGSNNPNPFHFPEEHRYAEALETFKLNAELFPSSWNVYDSYGEALVTTGNKQEAIKMYKRSIELNPQNEGGKKILAQLTQDQ
jgi:CubicO group peptidase (beta-lactamase class C family)